MNPAGTGTGPAPDVGHVRWIGGATGSGKSTVARLLAERCDVSYYDGDAAEQRHIARATPLRQPRLTAMAAMTPRQRWTEREPAEIFAEMPSLHGETLRAR